MLQEDQPEGKQQIDIDQQDVMLDAVPVATFQINLSFEPARESIGHIAWWLCTRYRDSMTKSVSV